MRLLDGSRSIPDLVDGQLVSSADVDANDILSANPICQSTATVRRDAFFGAGFLKPRMEYREDHELWARLAYFGYRFRRLPHELSSLRLHSGNAELKFKADDDHWQRMFAQQYAIKGPIYRKICFLVPGLRIGGGVAVVLKHAQMLAASDFDVTVINISGDGEPSWFGRINFPVVCLSDTRDYLFDNIDLLFCTGWQTADYLDLFPAARKLYFVQSDERRFSDVPGFRERVGQTYRRDCEYLTEARWIQDLLQSEFHHQVVVRPQRDRPAALRPGRPARGKEAGAGARPAGGPHRHPVQGDGGRLCRGRRPRLRAVDRQFGRAPPTAMAL